MKVIKYNCHITMPIQKQRTSLLRIKQKFQVTLPPKVREALHLQEGDLLEASVENNRIFLNPKMLVDKATIDTFFQEGLRDYHTGRGSGPFSSVKKFRASRKK